MCYVTLGWLTVSVVRQTLREKWFSLREKRPAFNADVGCLPSPKQTPCTPRTLRLPLFETPNTVRPDDYRRLSRSLSQLAPQASLIASHYEFWFRRDVRGLTDLCLGHSTYFDIHTILISSLSSFNVMLCFGRALTVCVQ